MWKRQYVFTRHKISKVCGEKPASHLCPPGPRVPSNTVSLFLPALPTVLGALLSQEIAGSSRAPGSFLVAAGLPAPGRTAHRASAARACAPWRPCPAQQRRAAPRPAPPRPGRRGPSRGRGRGGGRGVSGGPNGGSHGAGATWRRECCTPAERPRPAASYSGRPPAASCPGSGEQRRPFGEGPPRAEGAGSRRGSPPRPGHAPAGQCGRGGGAGGGGQRGRGGRAPSPRAQGQGGDGARRQGHVRRLCEPGQRDLSPARPGAAAGRWARGRGCRPCGRPAGARRGGWERLARAEPRCLQLQIPLSSPAVSAAPPWEGGQEEVSVLGTV